jgi:uncharacterized membrane protein HdeD (DUF308 family)
LAFFQKKSGAEKWLLSLILHTIGLLLGLSLIFNPFTAFLGVIRLIGIALLINGITRLFTDFIFTKEMDKINRKSDENIIDIEYTE